MCMSDGRITSVSLRPQLYANSAGMMKAACLAGVGVAVLPGFSCADELASGALVRCLPDYKLTPDRGIYAVYPHRRFLPAKVRSFIDLLEEHLKG